jgi:hypothetical protein
MNPVEKFLNMFRFRKKEGPKYTQCLTHRTWLSRQVQEEVIKQEAEANLSAIRKEENWYSKYL